MSFVLADVVVLYIIYVQFPITLNTEVEIKLQKIFGSPSF